MQILSQFALFSWYFWLPFYSFWCHQWKKPCHFIRISIFWYSFPQMTDKGHHIILKISISSYQIIRHGPNKNYIATTKHLSFFRRPHRRLSYFYVTDCVWQRNCKPFILPIDEVFTFGDLFINIITQCRMFHSSRTGIMKFILLTIFLPLHWLHHEICFWWFCQ